MKLWQRILAVLPLLVLFLALSRALAYVNEYYGSETGITETHKVLEKGTRYVPIPVATLRLQSPIGHVQTIEVPDKLAKQVNAGDPVEIVRSRGALGREWLQDKEFLR